MDQWKTRTARLRITEVMQPSKHGLPDEVEVVLPGDQLRQKLGSSAPLVLVILPHVPSQENLPPRASSNLWGNGSRTIQESSKEGTMAVGILDLTNLGRMLVDIRGFPF